MNRKERYEFRKKLGIYQDDEPNLIVSEKKDVRKRKLKNGHELKRNCFINLNNVKTHIHNAKREISHQKLQELDDIVLAKITDWIKATPEFKRIM